MKLKRIVKRGWEKKNYIFYGRRKQKEWTTPNWEGQVSIHCSFSRFVGFLALASYVCSNKRSSRNSIEGIKHSFIRYYSEFLDEDS